MALCWTYSGWISDSDYLCSRYRRIVSHIKIVFVSLIDLKSVVRQIGQSDFRHETLKRFFYAAFDATFFARVAALPRILADRGTTLVPAGKRYMPSSRSKEMPWYELANFLNFGLN